MSPERARRGEVDLSGAARGRVLRGGVAIGASPRAFPTIAVEPPGPRPAAANATDAASASASATPPAPPVAPIVDPAELERLRLDAAATGYEDGFAAGRDTAIAEVRQTAAALLARLDEAIAAQQARQTQTLDAIGQDVLGFALATVEALVGRELAVAEAPVRDAIERALRLAPERLPATLVVHPGDAELAALHDVPGRTITIVADETIEPGGCIVRVEDCEVDAQIATALRRLAAALHDEAAR
jgi:flagellar assembly protein FliH